MTKCKKRQKKKGERRKTKDKQRKRRNDKRQKTNGKRPRTKKTKDKTTTDQRRKTKETKDELQEKNFDVSFKLKKRRDDYRRSFKERINWIILEYTREED
jgi:hypothetical protein